MAVMKGKAGSLKKAGVAASYVNEWSIDTKLDTDDVTDFGDDWKAFGANLASWTAKASAFFDPSSVQQKAIHDAIVAATPAGALADLTFYLSATNYYSGAVIVVGQSISVNVSGTIKVSWDLQGNGALVYN